MANGCQALKPAALISEMEGATSSISLLQIKVSKRSRETRLRFRSRVRSKSRLKFAHDWSLRSTNAEKNSRASPYTRPYWHLERARVGSSLKVPVEIVVNGTPLQSAEIEADGALYPVKFNVLIQKSSWLALRILPSSHTNPAFVVLNGNPVRASRKSAEWCRKAVDASWKLRELRMRATEREEAQAAFEHAESTYDRIASECDT